jgi:hypothetical protein
LKEGTFTAIIKDGQYYALSIIIIKVWGKQIDNKWLISPGRTCNKCLVSPGRTCNKCLVSPGRTCNKCLVSLQYPPWLFTKWSLNIGSTHIGHRNSESSSTWRYQTFITSSTWRYQTFITSSFIWILDPLINKLFITCYFKKHK